jgi:hypothetical protein
VRNSSRLACTAPHTAAVLPRWSSPGYRPGFLRQPFEDVAAMGYRVLDRDGEGLDAGLAQKYQDSFNPIVGCSGGEVVWGDRVDVGREGVGGVGEEVVGLEEGLAGAAEVGGEVVVEDQGEGAGAE